MQQFPNTTDVDINAVMNPVSFSATLRFLRMSLRVAPLGMLALLLRVRRLNTYRIESCCKRRGYPCRRRKQGVVGGFVLYFKSKLHHLAEG